MRIKILHFLCVLLLGNNLRAQYIELERAKTTIVAKESYLPVPPVTASPNDTVYTVLLHLRLYPHTDTGMQTFTFDIGNVLVRNQPMITVNGQSSFTIRVARSEWPAAASIVVAKPVNLTVSKTLQGDTAEDIYVIMPRIDSRVKHDTNNICLIIVDKRPGPKKKPIDPLEILRNSFYYTVFTDFKGFRGDQPNGLVQSEFFFNFYFRDQQKLKIKKAFEAFHNVHLGVNLTKLGDNLRYKDLYVDKSNPTNPVKHLHYIDLVRYTNFEAYTKLNVLYSRIDSIPGSFITIPLRFYLDLYGSIKSTGVRDTTLVTKTPEFNANSLSYGWNIKLGTAFISNRTGHLDFEVGYTRYQVNLFNNNFILSGGPLYYPEGSPLNDPYRNDSYSKAIDRFEFKVCYAPSLNDRQTNMFFRVVYHVNQLGQTYRSQGYSSNSFLQVQLGYFAAFSSLFPSS